MLLTKCMYNVEALKVEIDNGLRYLEVVGFDGKPSSKELEDIENYIVTNNIIVSSVHMPTTSIREGCKVRPNIEYLENEVFRKNCKEICEYFHSLSARVYNNRVIKVIFHSKTRIEEYEVLDSTYKRIKDAVAELIGYTNIEICLENVPVIHYEAFGNSLVGNFGCGLNFIEVANKLSKDIGTDRIKALVDTCHTESNNAILRRLGRESDIVTLSKTLEFAYSKGLLGQIHIATQTGLGIVPGEHGLSLDLNKGLSDEIIKAVKPYIKEVDTTIEVEEDKYPEAKNALKSYRYIVNRIGGV